MSERSGSRRADWLSSFPWRRERPAGADGSGRVPGAGVRALESSRLDAVSGAAGRGLQAGSRRTRHRERGRRETKTRSQTLV